VKHFGSGVLLLPIDDPWPNHGAALEGLGPGFELKREQPEIQIREAFSPLILSIPNICIYIINARPASVLWRACKQYRMGEIGLAVWWPPEFGL